MAETVYGSGRPSPNTDVELSPSHPFLSPNASDPVDQDRRICGPFKWSILPISISVTSLIGFIVTFVLAKVNCHIQKWILPFVSYTGTEHPESMAFGLLLNVEGFLGFIVVFLAWRYYRHMGVRRKLNTAALVLGGMSCFGVIMVGNFQVTYGKIPHYIGAGLAFLVGNAYAYLASWLSKASFRNAQASPRYKKFVVIIRFFLAGLMTVSMLCLLGLVVYKKVTKKKKSAPVHYPTHPHNGSCDDILSGVPDEKKQLDFLASLSEWILTVGLLAFLSLFAFEFKTFRKVKVVVECVDSPLHDRRKEGMNTTIVTSYDPEPSSRGDSAYHSANGNPGPVG